MKPSLSTKLFMLCFALAAALVGCGGGGGGGGGADGRTTETAVRLLHGGIDAPTYGLRVGEVTLQTAHYLEQTSYAAVSAGPVELLVELGNLPGSTIFRLPVTLEDETEYSVLILGEASRGNLTALMLPEPVRRPETGHALIQVVNSYSTNVRAVIGPEQVQVQRGASSGFIDTLSAAPQTVSIYESGGGKIAEVAVAVADRGEATVLVSGSKELGVAFARVYQDLD